MRVASLLGALGFVLAEEGFEGVGAGEIVQEALALLRIHVGGEQFLTLLAELLEPGFVFRAELLFEFFAEALSQRGALAGGGDGDLQRAALRYGWVIEIAKLGHVHDVAQDAAAMGFAVNVLVQFVRARRGDDEKHAVKVGRLAGPREPFDLAAFGPGFDLRGGFGRDDADSGRGVEQAGDFGFGDFACADDKAAPALELEEHGEKARGRGLLGSRLHDSILAEKETGTLKMKTRGRNEMTRCG